MATTTEHPPLAVGEEVDARTAGYGISYAVTSILSALLVILKEEVSAVKGAMVALAGHHWIAHAILVVAVFVALGYVLSRGEGVRLSGNALASWIVGATVLGGLIIVGYFLFE